MNGQEVRRLRENLGYTQLQLAIAAGVSPGTIHRWENDKVRPSPLGVGRLMILEAQFESSQAELITKHIIAHPQGN